VAGWGGGGGGWQGRGLGPGWGPGALRSLGAGLKKSTLEKGGKEWGEGATLYPNIYNTGKSMTIAYIKELVTS
jgi:hypothetical protein